MIFSKSPEKPEQQTKVIVGRSSGAPINSQPLGRIVAADKYAAALF